jgi:hypothetical protein
MITKEVSFNDARVRRIVQAAFPGSKSRRTVKLCERTSYHVTDYWDGGSRNEARFIQLSTLEALSSESVPREARQQQANPYNLPIYDITLQPGFVVVEHCWFMGKSLGYRIYHCSNLQLGTGNELFALPIREELALTEG